MKLTPIKIPGKRTQKAGTKIVKNRLPGRSFGSNLSKNEVPVATSFSKSSKGSKKRSMKNMKSRLKMSQLEKLPVELLEDVFFYCLNVSLPKASPVIAGKLSSSSVYTKIIDIAFQPTWEVCYGMKRTPNDTNIILAPGDAVLQSSILSCRWANLPLLLKVQDDWVQRNAQDRPVEAIPFLPPETDQLVPPAPRKIVQLEYLEDDFRTFSNSILGKDLNRIKDCSWNTYIGVADGTEIPHGLLLGPWTEESIMYLYWMVKSGAKLEWVKSIIGEVALIGFKDAIAAGDLRVMHLLVWAGLREKVDLELVIEALPLAGGDKFVVMKTLLDMLGGISYSDSNRLWAATEKLRVRADVEGNDANLALAAQLETSDLLYPKNS